MLSVKFLLYDIVACYLPRGSKLQWSEDLGGDLPSARTRDSRAFAEASKLLGCKDTWPFP